MSGTVSVAHVARWDGAAWGTVGAGVNGKVLALLGFNDGSGARLYAGGQFTGAGAVAATNIASWNGSSWAALAGGLGASAWEYVAALAAHNDGSGPALYAGGNFHSASTLVCNSIARWRGGAWSALGEGIQQLVIISSSYYYTPGNVRSLVSFDDNGPGPRAAGLYAAGAFSLAGSAPVFCLARWDSGGWTHDLPFIAGGAASAMALMDDDGPGPQAQAHACHHRGGSHSATLDIEFLDRNLRIRRREAVDDRDQVEGVDPESNHVERRSCRRRSGRHAVMAPAVMPRTM